MKPEESPFIHKWENETARQIHELHAREVYKQLLELRIDSRRYHVDYGKWIIAALLAVHSGAIYVCSLLATAHKELVPKTLIGPVTWNLAGIVFIIFAGVMAWLNFQSAEALYARWTNPAMLYRADKWPVQDDSERFDPITTTLLLAVASALLSVWCLIASVVEIKNILMGA